MVLPGLSSFTRGDKSDVIHPPPPIKIPAASVCPALWKHPRQWYLAFILLGGYYNANHTFHVPQTGQLMPVIKLDPTDQYPVPYDLDEEKPTTFVGELQVAGATAELQVDMGAMLEVSPEDEARQARLLEEVIKNKKTTNLANQTTAYAANQFLKHYGQALAFDAVQARAAITSKLMEIADCGDPKYELKALELLGKHSDIGLFTNKSEITINYNDPQDLENAIKARVKRLLNADIIDVTPIGLNLDDELGVIDAPREVNLLDELDGEDDGE